MPLPSRPFFSRVQWWHVGLLLLLVALAFLPLFWLLTSHPAQQYDESRTGLNGLNILRTHDWLVLRDGELRPDLWNCKPPLWPWVLALSFQVVGPTELGLRLPAALAGLATTLVVYAAGRRWLGSREGGLLAALLLLTTQGYVALHVTRTGDFDALLTLWTTLGALSWLRYLAAGTRRAAALTGVFFFLAAFTKGIAGLLFGPGLVLAAVATGQLGRLRRPAPWLALLGLLAGMAAWYLVREQAAPGYLQAVWEYEVGGPATTQMEGHRHPFYYYLANLMELKFSFWLVPALLGGVLGWRLPRHSPGWWLVRFLVCVVVSFLLTLALTQTKLFWYDAPVYPLLALLAASGLLQMARAVAAQQHWHPGPAYRLGGLLLLLALPYWAQCRALVRVYDARHQVPALLYGQHLRHQARAEPRLKEYLLGTDGQFNDSPWFYRQAAQLAYQHSITVTPPWRIASDARPGHYVVVCGSQARRSWEQLFQTSVLVRTDSCATLLLEAYRPR